MKTFLLLISSLLTGGVLSAQTYSGLKPGFDQVECDDLLHLNAAFVDTTPGNRFEGYHEGYTFLYRSPSVGLDNMWDLWLRSDSTVVILLRGTTSDPRSILADFYCAMLPASGKIVLSPEDTVHYHLADDKRACLHGGFLIGFAYLSKDILPKLDSLYQLGYTNYLVSGHSQGGSLCYYVSAWLMHLKKSLTYPLLQVKTYASAATKVGNMYFVYDYDNLSRAEWGFSIINSADPVPEMPFTTQQVDVDMNEPNPILNLMKRFNDLPFVQRVAVKSAFKKMIKKSAGSSKTYRKYLGGYSASFIKRFLPELELPEAYTSTYFMRPGVSISLLANDAYKEYYNGTSESYYDHSIKAYRFLLRQYYAGMESLE
ncbi:MAG TPA: hypothetical protein VIK74_00750 [Parasegetibacter sp.]|jgi:hypothetical protein